MCLITNPSVDSIYPALSAVGLNSTGRPDLQEIIQQVHSSSYNSVLLKLLNRF